MQLGGVYNGWEFVFAQIWNKIHRYKPGAQIDILMPQGVWCIAFKVSHGASTVVTMDVFHGSLSCRPISNLFARV